MGVCLANKPDVLQSLKNFLSEAFLCLCASNIDLGTAIFTMDQEESDSGKMQKLMLSYYIIQ